MNMDLNGEAMTIADEIEEIIGQAIGIAHKREIHQLLAKATYTTLKKEYLGTMNKLPAALPCDECKKPTNLNEAGEVRTPTRYEREHGHEIVVTCVECYRKYNEAEPDYYLAGDDLDPKDIEQHPNTTQQC